MATDKTAQRKHKKSLARKGIVLKKKEEKKEKKKLTDKQIQQAMANMDRMESKRRIAILEYLISKGFDEDKKEMQAGRAIFKLKRTRYKLMKINYTDEMKQKLQQELGKYQGLYMIVDIKTEKKGIIFQVQYSKETEFTVDTIEEKI